MTFKKYKVRLFPTKDQEKMFWKHIHACRWMWNYAIRLNIDNHIKTDKFLNRYDYSKIITKLKENEKFNWIADVSVHLLYRVCDNVWSSYSRYLHKKAKLPGFKSRKTAKNSFPVRSSNNATYFISDSLIRIPKCGKIKCRIDYRKENIGHSILRLYDPYIKHTANGKWILTFSSEIENQDFVMNENGPLGIDMGIKEAATYSYEDLNGNIHTDVVHNINKSKTIKDLDRKITHIHRNISRKVLMAKKLGYDWNSSKRYQKELKRFRKLLYHRSNIIKDEYDKITSHIIYNIRPSIIWLEDLDIEAMRKIKHLSKEISDANWGLFRRMLEYKGEYFGIPVLYVPKRYPSSQLCSCCGFKQKMPLSKRVYECPNCGMKLDRDVNASMNLMYYKDYRNEDSFTIYLDKHV